MSTFLVVSILIGIAALLGTINERFLRLPPAIGLMLLALLLTLVLAGLNGIGIIQDLGWEETLVQKLDFSNTLLNGMLCFMLFAGSASVKLENLRKKKWTIISLATISTLIAWLLISVALYLTFQQLGINLSLGYALVFGALISPTDPIAALAVLKPIGLPKPLETIINGESLFNDGVGVVLFTMSLAFAQGSDSVGLESGIVLFLREVLGGIGLGLLLGFVAHKMLMITNSYANQLMITLATVMLGYSLALQVDVSGPIAMVVAGLFVGNIVTPQLSAEIQAPLRSFWHGLDELLNSLLFVMIGLAVILVHNLSWAPLSTIIPVAILTCLVVRAVSVFIPIIVLNKLVNLNAHSFGLTGLLTWGGLRGGLSLALALSLPQGPQQLLIVNMTFGVVVFSILVQGSTISKLFKPSFLDRVLRSN